MGSSLVHWNYRSCYFASVVLTFGHPTLTETFTGLYRLGFFDILYKI